MKTCIYIKENIHVYLIFINQEIDQLIPRIWKETQIWLDFC